MRGAVGRVGNDRVGGADASRGAGYQELVAHLVGRASILHAGKNTRERVCMQNVIVCVCVTFSWPHVVCVVLPPSFLSLFRMSLSV
jgi:hypothetical protein